MITIQSLHNLTQDVYQKYRHDGIKGVINSIPTFICNRMINFDNLEKTAVWLVPRTGLGKHWYKEDWDLLIILDTCRVDALEVASKNYDFVSNINTTISKGGQSAEWMANTFIKEFKKEIANTAFISSNPHAKSVFEKGLCSSFDDEPNQSVDRLQRFGGENYVSKEDFEHYQTFWDVKEKHGQCALRPVTNHTIQLARESQFERMVVHYMPPHAPYVASARKEDRKLEQHEKNPFDYIRETGDSSTVFESHVSELNRVLQEVELLLDNVDADSVIITSDHGDGFGKNKRARRHRAGHLSPKVRVVPWVHTTAVDSHTHEPNLIEQVTVKQSQKEALENLGYI